MSTHLTKVSEHEATVLVARVGDFCVSQTSGGAFVAPTYFAVIARLELRSYQTGAPIDWCGLWSLIRNTGWCDEAERQASFGRSALLAWLVEWLAAFGVHASDVQIVAAERIAA